MEPVSLESLERDGAQFDAAVLESDDIDLFCSSTDWILPAAAAFGTSAEEPARKTWIRRGEAGWIALTEVEVLDASSQPVGLQALQPLEAVWGLACPLIGCDPKALASDFAFDLAQSEEKRHVLLLCGMARESKRFGATVNALGPRYELRLGPSTKRFIASLDGGVDGFLSRRSSNFRDGIRKARRRAKERGLSIETLRLTDPEKALAAYERLLVIERESWKGHEGHGLESSTMVDFYRAMVVRLARRDALLLSFAMLDGKDVAYILGGTFGNTYRGLQFSFCEGFEKLSLGNLLQMHEIEWLSEKKIDLYDLGTDVEYKKRWGEIEQNSVTLIALPRR